MRVEKIRAGDLKRVKIWFSQNCKKPLWAKPGHRAGPGKNILSSCPKGTHANFFQKWSIFGNLFFNFLGICSFHVFRKRKYVESGFSVFFAGMIGREIVIPL